MVFSSIPFLYFFLPILFILYFAVPIRAKNAVLLSFSLFFYTLGEPLYIFLMLFSIAQAFFFALLIDRSSGKKRKLWLLVTLVFSLLPLLVCKYGGFIVTNVNHLFSASIPIPKIPLPLGISFYTFQIIAYSVDVFREKTAANRNIFSLALYVSLFPQLVAGPIVRYSDISRELYDRKHTLEGFSAGAVRFTIGLSKKVLIANVLGELSSALGKSMLGVWAYAISASLQIYYDFSGYSDMAIGLGKMFGFSFPENFNYPYISKSITEFWRRWHMTLGSWFRDYVYIPMGGNRVSPLRHIFNILVVWMLTGLWHGAEWNFVLWGLYFALLLSIEKMLSRFIEKIPSFIRHISVLFLVMISFIIFNSSSVSEIFSTVAVLFDFSNPTDTISLYYVKSYFFTLLASIIGATPIICRTAKNLSQTKFFSALTPALTSIFLLISTAYIVNGSYNPFLYFRF